ncbi:FHA domain-containing protein [Mycolicibacterium rutilum]|uniref:FHA domain-containing protein n=1 Tax=Mycolicibacterium rutilum TaxID=370526 RepID=A0A1H6IDA6_MYCRU|nr:FHA domain-containing protein [Mycolicibacterium rutilum]SEH46797.1 FHA domain-containing protein [Mycolicibacterium rutilum]
MATPMRCRAHGRLTGDVCEQPGCFEPVEPDVDAAQPQACAEPGCDMPVPCPLHSTGAKRDAAEAAAYITANQATAQTDTELRFPWGPVALEEGELIIGRDHADRCGAQIEEFTNVSRLHAKLTLRDGQLSVEDQASTNGTTVNGDRIDEYQPTALADGDVIGFGAHLRAVVAMRRTGQ